MPSGHPYLGGWPLFAKRETSGLGTLFQPVSDFVTGILGDQEQPSPQHCDPYLTLLETHNYPHCAIVGDCATKCLDPPIAASEVLNIASALETRSEIVRPYCLARTS